MVKDEIAIKSKNKQIIEALVGHKVKVWVPIMATQLYMVDKNGEIGKVEAVRVRNFENEK